MERTPIAKLCFSITGEFLTKFCRDLVLEGKWRFALKVLIQDVHGMNYDTAFNILSGHAEIIGDSRNKDLRLKIVDDPEYIKQLLWHYGGMYEPQVGLVIRPYGKVTKTRASDSMGVSVHDPSYLHATKYANESGWRGHLENFLCIMKYLDDPHKDFIIPYDGVDVLWKVVSDYPFFLRTHKDADDAYDEFIENRDLREQGYVERVSNFEPTSTAYDNAEAVLERLQKSNDKKEAELDAREARLKERKEKPKPLGLMSDKMSEIVGYAQMNMLMRMQIENSEKEPYELKVDPTMESPYGWILPNGDWYNCTAMNHDAVASEIFEKLDIDHNGIDVREHASKIGWVGVHSSIVDKDGVTYSLNRKLTQKQIDRIFEYTMKHNKTFPQKDIDFWTH